MFNERERQKRDVKASVPPNSNLIRTAGTSRRNLINFLCLLIMALCFISSTEAQQCQPTLTATTGQGFQEITLSFTGVTGSTGWYNIYGAEAGGAYGDPMQVYVGSGQNFTQTTNYYGINALMDTNKTYNFYVTTTNCGTTATSNVASATTRDIDAPVLSVTPGPGLEQVTLFWTGVQGSNGWYNIYGSPNPNGPFGDPIGVSVAAGQAYSSITNVWGINAYLDTNRTY